MIIIVPPSRCGMVDKNVFLEQPVVSEWMQTLHLTHSHMQQLLSMLASNEKA